MWEYFVVTLRSDVDASKLLSDYGKGGWELVSVIFVAPHDFKDGRMTTPISGFVRHFFKRQLKQ